jgi:hypothetical protein
MGADSDPGEFCLSQMPNLFRALFPIVVQPIIVFDRRGKKVREVNIIEA